MLEGQLQNGLKAYSRKLCDNMYSVTNDIVESLVAIFNARHFAVCSPDTRVVEIEEPVDTLMTSWDSSLAALKGEKALVQGTYALDLTSQPVVSQQDGELHIHYIYKLLKD